MRADRGFVTHVEGGEYFFFLARRGQPFGVKRGPFGDMAAVENAVKAVRRIMAARRAGGAAAPCVGPSPIIKTTEHRAQSVVTLGKPLERLAS